MRSVARAARSMSCAVAFLCIGVSVLHSAAAREDGAVRRSHRAEPAHVAQTAADRTGSLGHVATGAKPSPGPSASAPAPMAVPPPSSADEGPLVPVLLPSAPRSRMVLCGEEWRAKKTDGTTGDDSWRDFALKCLVAKNAAP